MPPSCQDGDRTWRHHTIARFAPRLTPSTASPGAVVVTNSLAGLRASPAVVPYTASKHAAIGLARSAAIEGAPRGVRVNVVAPRLIETPLRRPLAEAPPCARPSTRCSAGRCGHTTGRVRAEAS